MKIIIISGLIFLILLLLLSSIQVEILYKREDSNDLLEIIVKYLRFIKFKFDIPLIEIDRRKKGLGLKLASKFGSKSEADIGKEEFFDVDKIIMSIKNFKLFYHNYKRIFDYTIKKLLIKELNIRLRFGLDSPAITGISTGLVYAILHNIVSFLSYKTNMLSHNISIEPVFKSFVLNIYFNCIFTLGVGNIIYVCLQIAYIFIIHKLSNNNGVGVDA